LSLRFDTKSEKVSFDLEANPTGWQENCFFRLSRPRLRVLITAKGWKPSTAEGVRFSSSAEISARAAACARDVGTSCAEADVN
jgi:hypothetical protein